MTNNLQSYEQFLNEGTANNSVLDQSIMLITGLLKSGELKKMMRMNQPIESIMASSKITMDQGMGKEYMTQEFVINKILKVEVSCAQGSGMEPQCTVTKM
ncbi:hypothetical protein EBS02_01645 [bacterium]|jgi:Tfp pilus assembly pilus retraction ATPase PilT|nr:hypothetical protein [bacterium]